MKRKPIYDAKTKGESTANDSSESGLNLHAQSMAKGAAALQKLREQARAKPSAQEDVSRELRIKAMREFIGGGHPMPRKVVDEILAEDYYDQ